MQVEQQHAELQKHTKRIQELEDDVEAWRRVCVALYACVLHSPIQLTTLRFYVHRFRASLTRRLRTHAHTEIQ